MRNFNKLKIRIGFINTLSRVGGKPGKNTVKILCLTAGLQLKMYGLKIYNKLKQIILKQI